jgi:hypothetical protein
MDTLLMALAFVLLCIAGWLLYKRYSARYQTPPQVVEPEEFEDEEEEPKVQETKAGPAPEPKKEQ